MNEPYQLLLVDDNRDQLELVSHAIRTQYPFARITIAETGAACLQELSENSFSAVLLDYSLPRMTGLEVLAEIQQRRYDVPVIIVTGRGDETIAVEAMKSGASDYVIKKVGYEKILPTIVTKVIQQHALNSRLAQTEERYHRLVECAYDVVCLVDLQGQILMLNPQFQNLAGDLPEEWAGKPIKDLIHPRDHGLFQRSFEDICHGSKVRLECQILHKDRNTIKWVSVGGGALWERKMVSGAILILRDITDQKQAEMALVKKNWELQFLLEVGNTLVSHHDLLQVLGIFARRVTEAVMTTYSRIFLLENGKLVVKAVYPIRELKWSTGFGEGYWIHSLPDVKQALYLKRAVILPYGELKQALCIPEQKTFLVSDLEDIQSLAIVPLIRKEEVLGLIVLGERRQWERQPLTQDQIVLCEAIAHQAAIAVENATLIQALKAANLDTIKALGGALETKDLDTKGHSDRTVALALSLARKIGLSEQEQEWTQYTAILHDIGKIGIPESILNKPEKLTHEEFEVMKRHPELGCDIISQIEFLKPIVPFVRSDHERWDGKGYPDRLAGESIPLISRLVSIVDAYDAMTSDRVYRRAPGKAYAIEELKRCAGTQFDPDLVKFFLEQLDSIT